MVGNIKENGVLVLYRFIRLLNVAGKCQSITIFGYCARLNLDQYKEAKSIPQQPYALGKLMNNSRHLTSKFPQEKGQTRMF